MPTHRTYDHEYLWITRNPSAPARSRPETFLLSGELDLGNVEQLRRAVMPAATQNADLLLDLSRLEFMDCSGISVMIEIVTAVRPNGRLIIRQPSPPVRRVLELVHADSCEGLVIES